MWLFLRRSSFFFAAFVVVAISAMAPVFAVDEKTGSATTPSAAASNAGNVSGDSNTTSGLGPEPGALKKLLPQPTSSSGKVPVEIEWEEVAGAKFYELEFQNFEGKVLNTFKSPSPLFKFKFRVGRYRVRSRAADSRKVYGDWSALQEFVVQPKPAKISEKSIVTKGVVDKKTLKSDVIFHWGEAPGASQFRLKIVNQNNEVVFEGLVKGFYYKTQLGAGEYVTTLTSIGDDGIESEPVTLPGKVVIETVQLEKPVIVLEEVADPKNPRAKISRLPLTKGVPTVRWKNVSALADTVGVLEYRYFFGEEWLPVDQFVSKNAREVILEKSRKPGRYRITTWAESAGLKKSEPSTYEFVVKPTEY